MEVIASLSSRLRRFADTSAVKDTAILLSVGTLVLACAVMAAQIGLRTYDLIATYGTMATYEKVADGHVAARVAVAGGPVAAGSDEAIDRRLTQLLVGGVRQAGLSVESVVLADRHDVGGGLVVVRSRIQAQGSLASVDRLARWIDANRSSLVLDRITASAKDASGSAAIQMEVLALVAPTTARPSA